MPDVLLVETGDRIAVVTMNRPAARNALNAELRGAIGENMAALDADDSIDVIVLTGADPAFCAGLDLKELGSGGAGLTEEGESFITRRRGPLPELSKPLIAAVNGVAITGGFELALNCDFIIASERARFADTHARIGVMPGWGLTVLLPQAIGIRRAKQLSGTGNFLDARTACEWNLVNQVVPHDELLPFTLSLAADIAGNDSAGVGHIYRTYDEGALLSADEAWDLEARRAGEWLAGVKASDIEERRRAVTERGRSQL
ncbi:MAG: Crotonyl-CoA hydratase [Acidimicrobiales bacterium]|nr:MAG: enoyl-CoA hydratase [Actinomycetota bacterium]MBV6507805.1 Crotonyl-CoA hydratase [Acidimicrobiales bacterium]RIK06041.1 MAG: enoyl-CoA hydratase [Acidobacteriota bacterium]